MTFQLFVSKKKAAGASCGKGLDEILAAIS
jgi:hypothetical protein